MKRKIKCGWTGCRSLKRSLVRLSYQVSVAFWACSLGARSRFAQASCVQKWTGHVRLRFAWRTLKRTLNSSEKKLRISKPFFPNTPILILPYSKLVPNNVYRSCT